MKGFWGGTAAVALGVIGRWLAAYVFVGLLLLAHLLFIGDRGELYTMARPWHGVASVVLPTVLVLLMHADPRRMQRERLVLAVFGVALLAILPTLFTMRAFGTRELAQILLYLAHINPDEATRVLATDHRSRVIEITLGMAAIMALAVFLLRRVRGFAPGLFGLAGLMAANSLPASFAGMLWGGSAVARLIDPETEVVRPVILTEPERPLNLILIYFESMEEAIAHLPSTREAFAPLEALSRQGLRLRGLGQYPGTDYSAGGFVATQCGVPLLTPDGSYFMPSDGGRASRMGPVMPTLLCLGDILSDRGYRTAFYNGADLTSYGIEAFLSSHGFATVFDLRSFEAEGLAARQNAWGVEDDVFHARVRQALTELAAGDAPFLLALENIGTHPPDGYLDPSCNPPGSGPRMPAAIACGVRHILDLLDLVDRLGLSETTLVAVLSDHLMMSSTLNAELRAHDGPRHNFALFLNAGQIGQIERRASLMDVYPTLLELMGFGIQDGRAGMGHSLLSDGETLVERLGEPALDSALRLNMPLSRC